MRIHSLILAAVAVAIPLAVACEAPKEPNVPTSSSAPPATTTAPAATSAAPAATTAAPTAAASTAAPAASTAPAAPMWRSGMTKDEQMAFMKDHIMPAMTKVFQDHDKTKYAKFSCTTCHGPKYQEPREFLPALVLKDGKLVTEKPKKTDAEMSKWMGEAVTPAMVKAMGLQPYDPATQKGFGCGGCHAIKH